MAVQRGRVDGDIAIIAGAIVVGMGVAAGVSATMTWLLSRHASPQPRPAADPVLEMLRTAPLDDEPLTDAQAARIAAALAAAARGEVAPLPASFQH